MRSASAEHATHDETLVTRYASGDLEPAERGRAEALVSECRLCGELVADVVALRSAVQQLPMPRRTRDFRLTPEQAERARPRGWWARLVAVTGGGGGAFAGPLAGALVTLGLVGLLLSSGVLPGSFGSGSAQPAMAPSTLVPAEAYGGEETARPVAPGVAGPEASGYDKGASEPPRSGSQAGGVSGGAGAPPSPAVPANDQASQAPTAPTAERAATPAPRPATPAAAAPGVPLLPLVSAAALVIGVVMLVLRLVARRAP